MALLGSMQERKYAPLQGELFIRNEEAGPVPCQQSACMYCRPISIVITCVT